VEVGAGFIYVERCKGSEDGADNGIERVIWEGDKAFVARIVLFGTCLTCTK
jgi:hypothetical protein